MKILIYYKNKSKNVCDIIFDYFIMYSFDKLNYLDKQQNFLLFFESYFI